MPPIAPIGESEKSISTAGFSSEISPQFFAYFLSVTFLTTAPQVESSSLTSSFSSVTIFSGTEGRATSGWEAADSFFSRDSNVASPRGASVFSTSFVATTAACSAARRARSFERPISLQIHHARTAPSARQISFSTLFISPSPFQRNRVITPCAKRMAPQDSPDTQKNALEQTMHLQRLNHVVRTARRETATVPEQRAQHDLIRLDEQNQRR